VVGQRSGRRLMLLELLKQDMDAANLESMRSRGV
jgi:hypothetical protein